MNGTRASHRLPARREPGLRDKKETMELDIWGVRGTHPVSDPAKGFYGGNTTCSSLMVSDNEVLVIDAGTGIIGLGLRLKEDRADKDLRIHVFLSHFHLDHIIGLPFFLPLHSANASLTFYAAAPAEETEKRLGGLMAGRYHPVRFGDTPSVKAFRSLPAGTLTVGGVEVTTCALRHPQGCLGYRLRGAGRTVVLAIDTEAPEKGADPVLAGLAKGADVLVHDATFAPEAYPAKKGWGHSTWQGAVRAAQEAGVGRLYLSHFDPGLRDREIAAMVRSARKLFPRTWAAREVRGGPSRLVI